MLTVRRWVLFFFWCRNDELLCVSRGCEDPIQDPLAVFAQKVLRHLTLLNIRAIPLNGYRLQPVTRNEELPPPRRVDPRIIIVEPDVLGVKVRMIVPLRREHDRRLTTQRKHLLHDFRNLVGMICFPLNVRDTLKQFIRGRILILPALGVSFFQALLLC